MSSTLELLVNGKLFSGWKSATFSSSMEALSSTFAISARDKDNSLAELEEGVPCVAYAVNGSSKDKLLDGFIVQRRESITSTAHTVSISGSDKLIDLVDCAVVRENRSWIKVRFSRIIKDLADPFSVVVDTSDLSDDPIIDKMTLQSGESPFAAIDRLCKSQAVLPLGAYDGTLLLTYAADQDDRFETDLVLGENIKEFSRDSDWSEVFSEYTTLGQAAGRGKRWTEAMLQGKAVATDENVTRYRPQLFIAETRSSKTELTKRVAWEAQIRAGRATSQTVTLKGWYTNGSLWEKNKRVRLRVPEKSINEDRLIVNVSFTLDNSRGEETTLTLRHPDVYKADPTLKVDLT